MAFMRQGWSWHASSHTIIFRLFSSAAVWLPRLMSSPFSSPPLTTHNLHLLQHTVLIFFPQRRASFKKARITRSCFFYLGYIWPCSEQTWKSCQSNHHARLCFFVVVILQRSRAANWLKSSDSALLAKCFCVLLSTELSDRLGVRWKEGEKNKKRSFKTALRWLQNVIKAGRWLNSSASPLDVTLWP